MRYKCENCGSLFIVNQNDPRVQSGDYQMLPGVSDCPLCKADLKKVNSRFSLFTKEAKRP
jgi:rubredoxin